MSDSDRLLTEEEIRERLFQETGFIGARDSRHEQIVTKAQDAKTAKALIEDIEGKAERVSYHKVAIGICLNPEDWQAIKEKWLGKG